MESFVAAVGRTVGMVALLVAGISSPAWTQAQVETITVVDRDNLTRGVQSLIFVVSGSGALVPIGQTDPQGRVTINPVRACQPGERIQARPGDLAPGYTNSNMLFCARAMTLQVQARAVLNRVLLRGWLSQQNMLAGQNADVAIGAFYEVFVRTGDIEPAIAASARRNALVAGVRYVGVTSADPGHDYSVAFYQLFPQWRDQIEADVRGFQAQSGLPATGRLDALTYDALRRFPAPTLPNPGRPDG